MTCCICHDENKPTQRHGPSKRPICRDCVMSNVELQAIARMYESLEKDAVTEKLAEKFAASGVTGFVMLGSARDISSACNCWRCQQERAKNAN